LSLIFATAIYFVIWWTVLFAVLPFAGQSQQDAGSRIPGTPASAPAAPKLLRVALITSLLAAVLLAMLYFTIEYNLLDRIGLPIRAPAAPPAG
jgi:predicted secreted protein